MRAGGRVGGGPPGRVREVESKQGWVRGGRGQLAQLLEEGLSLQFLQALGSTKGYSIGRSVT